MSGYCSRMPKPWKVLRRSTYRHSRFRAIEDVDYELPTGEVRTYALKKEGRVVTVFPMTADRQIVLARQFRPGPGRVLDELPAGGVKEGESAADAAARELMEETGYRAERFITLGNLLECAYSTIQRTAFVGLNCERVTEQQLDLEEDIEVVLKSVPEFFQQLRSGQSSDLEVGWAALEKLGFLKLV